MMEWDEFTRFVVVKAQLHHAQMSIDQLAEYRQGPRQASRGGGGRLAYFPIASDAISHFGAARHDKTIRSPHLTR